MLARKPAKPKAAARPAPPVVPAKPGRPANGAAEVALIVVAAHLKRIRAGDMRAIEWWEKARLGWRERVVEDDAKPAENLRVIIEFVGDPAPIQIEQDRPRPGFDNAKFVQLLG